MDGELNLIQARTHAGSMKKRGEIMRFQTKILVVRLKGIDISEVEL